MDIQTVKCRDDRKPVQIEHLSKSPHKFKLAEGHEASWLPNGEFGADKLRSHIEPWLTALFQSEHLALLTGSGIMHAACRFISDEKPQGMDNHAFANFQQEIDAEARRSVKAMDREVVVDKPEKATYNIEDQIRVANEIYRGLQILGPTIKVLEGKDVLLGKELKDVLTSFSTAILKSENIFISGEDKKRERATNYLVSFLMSFASRTGTRDRLQIFTTNYERLIELVAELAGLYLVDRFVGNVAPIFRSSRLEVDIHYNPPGIRGEPRYVEGVARFTKLHGSVDWVQVGQTIRRVAIPFGASAVTQYLDAPGFKGATPYNLMIYPNSAKDRETAAYPYVELFRDFACAVCRPNSTVVTYGYSFNDEHINRVIEDMLTIPSTHLVAISYSDISDRIIKTYEKMGRPAQITLLVGSHFGDLETLVDHYLPKPAIDRTTFRMADLLKARFHTGKEKPSGEEEKKEAEKAKDVEL